MVVYFWPLVEKHQDAHLVGGHRHFIPLGTIVANSCANLRLPLVEFPVELPSCELCHVVLLVDAHTILNLGWNGYEINHVKGTVLLRWVTALVWPVAGGQYLHIQVNLESLTARTLLEVLHPLLGHLDILEHYLESMSKVVPALLLQLLHHFLLSVLKDSPRVKETLCKVILVETLKYVLVLQIPENLDNLVNFFRDLDLGVVLEVFLELVVKERN